MKLPFSKKKKEKPAEGEEAEAEAPAEKEEAASAEGENGADGEGAPAEKPKKKKMIIIAAAAALVLILGGAGAFFMMGGKGEEEHAPAEGEVGEDGKPVLKAVFYTLPEFLVNLNTGGTKTSFLKVTVILEVQKAADVPVIEANLPRLMDSFNTYLRDLRASDLNGSAGTQRLREELLLRSNRALDPLKINDVLFKSIVVQ